MSQHGVTFDRDREGWDFAQCLCGWTSAPMPDKEEAAEAYADHRIVVALDEEPGA